MAANTYLIDSTDLLGVNGITVLKATGIYDAAKQRITKHEWPDKSGSDVDFENVYFDEHDITLKCLCVATSKANLAAQMFAFSNAIKAKGLMVLSVRTPFRKAFLIYRENAIAGKYSVAAGGEFAFEFTLKLTCANPNALVTQIDTPTTNHTYTNTKGTGWLHWGDGVKQFLELSGDYSHEYPAAGKYDIIMDVDQDNADVDPPFVIPDFDADKNAKTVTAIISKPFLLQFNGDPDGYGYSAQDCRIEVTLNNDVTIYEIAQGSALKDVNITKEFLDVQSDSYLKIIGYQWDGSNWFINDVLRLLTGGTFALINAGAKRLNFFTAADGNSLTHPHNILLSFNNIPESDINDLLEKYQLTVDDAAMGEITFDISGGSSAIPTSVDALACKADLQASQNYSDNE